MPLNEIDLASLYKLALAHPCLCCHFSSVVAGLVASACTSPSLSIHLHQLAHGVEVLMDTLDPSPSMSIFCSSRSARLL